MLKTNSVQVEICQCLYVKPNSIQDSADLTLLCADQYQSVVQPTSGAAE